MKTDNENAKQPTVSGMTSRRNFIRNGITFTALSGLTGVMLLNGCQDHEAHGDHSNQNANTANAESRKADYTIRRGIALLELCLHTLFQQRPTTGNSPVPF